ncbi:MAG TPA: hypothetical protein VF173_36760 [Thermoanaerobaculia bacterium]|nr:hypothetical protein [Thermoanaerobaculia bacterium]
MGTVPYLYEVAPEKARRPALPLCFGRFLNSGALFYIEAIMVLYAMGIHSYGILTVLYGYTAVPARGRTVPDRGKVGIYSLEEEMEIRGFRTVRETSRPGILEDWAYGIA